MGRDLLAALEKRCHCDTGRDGLTTGKGSEVVLGEKVLSSTTRGNGEVEVKECRCALVKDSQAR